MHGGSRRGSRHWSSACRTEHQFSQPSKLEGRKAWGDAGLLGRDLPWEMHAPCLFYPRPPLSCLGAQLGLILLSHCCTHGGAAQALGKVAWCQVRHRHNKFGCHFGLRQDPRILSLTLKGLICISPQVPMKSLSKH